MTIKRIRTGRRSVLKVRSCRSGTATVKVRRGGRTRRRKAALRAGRTVKVKLPFDVRGSRIVVVLGGDRAVVRLP